MLVHISHVHNWESCPYHDKETAGATFGKMLREADDHVRIVGAWVDAAAHQFFIVAEAESAEDVEAFLAPVIDRGYAKTQLVQEAAGITARRSGDV